MDETTRLIGDPGGVTTERLVAKIKHQKLVIEKLVRLAAALTSRIDVVQMLDVVRNECAELLGADRCAVYLLDRERRTLGLYSAPDKMLEDVSLPLDRTSVAGCTALTQSAFRIADVRRMPPDAGCRFNDVFDRLSRYRTLSLVSAPMVQSTGETLGVIQALNKNVEGKVVPFTEYDLEIARALASLSAAMIEKTMLAIDAASRLDELEENRQFVAETTEALRHSERLSTIGQLAASVAHEINSPITGIISYANFILGQRRLHHKIREDALAIKEQAQRISTIVRNLLDYSRKKTSVMEFCSLNEVITDTMSFCEHFLSRFQHVKLELNLEEPSPKLHLSKVEIQEVLINLIRNAAQAMPGGGALTVSTSVVSTIRPPTNISREIFEKLTRVGTRDTTRYALVRVDDTGAGIPYENLRKLFKPFFTTKQGGDGTGLGLSISQEIVVRHGGLVDVATAPGKGSTFFVFLPM
ncbi:MAG: ATP-binding protein [bacterium]